MYVIKEVALSGRGKTAINRRYHTYRRHAQHQQKTVRHYSMTNRQPSEDGLTALVHR